MAVSWSSSERFMWGASKCIRYNLAFFNEVFGGTLGLNQHCKAKMNQYSFHSESLLFCTIYYQYSLHNRKLSMHAILPSARKPLICILSLCYLAIILPSKFSPHYVFSYSHRSKIWFFLNGFWQVLYYYDLIVALHHFEGNYFDRSNCCISSWS